MGEDIAGTEASVKGTTLEDLNRAYDHFYSPRNMALLVAGDVDPHQMIAYIDEILPEAFLKKKSSGRLVLDEEPRSPGSPETDMAMGIPTPIFNFFIKGPGAALTPEDYKTSMVRRIALEYLFGKGSAFFNTAYEEGLLNSTFGYEYSYGQGYSYLALGGESSDPRRMTARIKSALEAFNREGMDAASFMRIKRKILGRNISAFNSIQTIANNFIGHYIKGVDIFDGMKMVEGITMEEVEKSLGMTLKDRTVLSVVR
jgi:predicted Zn-dependent peptidase